MFHQRLPRDLVEDHSSKWSAGALFVGTAVLIAASIVFRTGSKDESQYVAAVALMRHGWPYLDFAYLQTPLQPLLLSPLALLPAGWVYSAVRAANGLCALGALLVLSAAIRRRAAPRDVYLAMAALACSQPFLLAASLARNDALPMLLIAVAIAALLLAIERRSPRAFAVGGLFLGLATSAKISGALPAAGVLLFLAIRARRFGFRSLAAFAVGALAGLLPCFIFALAAPSDATPLFSTSEIRTMEIPSDRAVRTARIGRVESDVLSNDRLRLDLPDGRRYVAEHDRLLEAEDPSR